ncbi:hypothetical protein [Dinoroseobacter sp. S124A]|uniref:hypothetical protein n=1 Tax=Dinoroseobacter sp. S124A TaxID=3415128 RepID=UPI003C7D28F5
MRNSFYLPLLGGPRREDIEIIDVSVPDGQGSVEIIGDVFRFTAGPELQQFPIGVPLPVIVSARYLDGDGKDVTTAIPVIAINTPVGVSLQLPGGQQVLDSGLMSPIAPNQMFDAPFTTGTPDISTTLDESIFVDIFNAANPQFLEAFLAAQDGVVAKTNAFTEAVAAFEEAENALELVQGARDSRLATDALQLQADTFAQVLQDALDEFAAAQIAFTNAALAVAQADAEIASLADQVNALNAQVEIFSVQFASFNTSFVQKTAEISILLAQLGLPAPVEQHLDTPVGAVLQPLVDQRDAFKNLSDTALASFEQAEQELEQVAAAFTEAQNDFVEATLAQAQAQARLEEAGEVDFQALEDAVDQLEAQVLANDSVATQLETVVKNEFGVEVPVSQNTVQEFEAAFVEAVNGKVSAELELAQAQATFQVAAASYQAQLDELPDVEFTWDIFSAKLSLGANLGFEFSFNRATDDDPFEAALALVYDVEIGLALDSRLTIKDLFLGIDEDVDVDVNDSITIAGRYEFDGANRPSGERFADLGDRFSERGERLADWSDSFDFL